LIHAIAILFQNRKTGNRINSETKSKADCRSRNRNRKTKSLKQTMKRAIANTETETEKTIRLRVTSSTIKNKKSNEMKTKNNVQKTVLRTGAVVVSFVLISFTVAAQDFWKTLLTNSSFNQIALAMTENSKKSEAMVSDSKTNKATYIYENESEPKMVVENWMTNNAYFRPIVLQAAEKENELKVEDWMKNEKLFATGRETESPLTIENWMTSSKVWKN